MSLKNLYFDLSLHLNRALANHNHELSERIKNMMSEIKSYAASLEGDLSLLNGFYNGKKAWPGNILKIRQTIYKKRHAQVLLNKKNTTSMEKKAPLQHLKCIRRHEYKYHEEKVGNDSATGEENLKLNIADTDLIKTSDEERTWWLLALGEK